MSVLIDMDMPKVCNECPFCCNPSYFEYAWCELLQQNFDMNESYNKVADFCPITEVPTPHGRLIDKDKLRHELFVNFNGERIPFYDCDNFPTKIAYRDLHSILAEQKTVIEAEGSEE